jgi:hypothetical protein
MMPQVQVLEVNQSMHRSQWELCSAFFEAKTQKNKCKLWRKMQKQVQKEGIV